MQGAVIEFYRVESNLTIPEEPRIFLIKRKNNKIVLTLEIDEFSDSFFMSEFDETEAEFWGKFSKIDEYFDVLIEVEPGITEYANFSEDITRDIETLALHKHALSVKDKKTFILRWIPSSKHRNSKRWHKTEDTYMKRLKAGIENPRGVCYDWNDKV